VRFDTDWGDEDKRDGSLNQVGFGCLILNKCFHSRSIQVLQSSLGIVSFQVIVSCTDTFKAG